MNWSYIIDEYLSPNSLSLFLWLRFPMEEHRNVWAAMRSAAPVNQQTQPTNVRLRINQKCHGSKILFKVCVVQFNRTSAP